MNALGYTRSSTVEKPAPRSPAVTAARCAAATSALLSHSRTSSPSATAATASTSTTPALGPLFFRIVEIRNVSVIEHNCSPEQTEKRSKPAGCGDAIPSEIDLTSAARLANYKHRAALPTPPGTTGCCGN